MSDLIDRQAAIDTVKNVYKSVYPEDAERWIIDSLGFLPSIEPEVIRCKECDYCKKEDEYELWCYGFCCPARLVAANDFCSHAKRRDNLNDT